MVEKSSETVHQGENMSEKQLNENQARTFVKTCREFTAEIAEESNFDPKIISEYLSPQNSYKAITLQEIFIRLITSAANANMLSNVIEFSTNKDKTRKDKILHAILGVKGLESTSLKDKEFRSHLEQFSAIDIDKTIIRLKNTEGILKGNKREVLWCRWLRSVQDTASFLLSFKSGGDFSKHFTNLPSDYLFAGPILIKRKITGIGFALACDALKELGFTQYVKPDTHINEVFIKLGLACEVSSTLDTQLNVFDAAIRLVNTYNSCCSDQITAYELDKLIWLSCTGHFYLHKKRFGKGKKDLRNLLIQRLNDELTK
jgi:hypothetical protein